MEIAISIIFFVVMSLIVTALFRGTTNAMNAVGNLGRKRDLLNSTEVSSQHLRAFLDDFSNSDYDRTPLFVYTYTKIINAGAKTFNTVMGEMFYGTLILFPKHLLFLPAANYTAAKWSPIPAVKNETPHDPTFAVLEQTIKSACAERKWKVKLLLGESIFVDTPMSVLQIRSGFYHVRSKVICISDITEVSAVGIKLKGESRFGNMFLCTNPDNFLSEVAEASAMYIAALGSAVATATQPPEAQTA